MSAVVAPSTSQIEFRSGLSASEFARDYVEAQRPVVLTDLVENWRALAEFTPAFFATRYADREVELEGKTWRMADLIAVIDSPEPGAKRPYYRNIPLVETFPDLREYVEPTGPFWEPNWIARPFANAPLGKSLNRVGTQELFIGGLGGGFPVLHWDTYRTHVLLTQIYGQKKFYVFGPEQTPFLYPEEKHPLISQVRDMENPDLEKFPLFAKATPIVFTLGPGDTLFIPQGWWHTTKMLGTSISLSKNFANHTNWDLVSREVCKDSSPLNKLKGRFYLWQVGRQRRHEDASGATRNTVI
jgi:histone arginine demethylase JMJD6